MKTINTNKIKVIKDPNGDTRTAKKDVTFEEFSNANFAHRISIANTLHWIAKSIEDRGLNHDWSKIELEKEFYKDFKNTLENGTDFTQGEWYKFHIEKERHHLLARCPEDVNIIDVIEMICDCVSAGLSRSGEVRELEISDDILRKAVNNTVKLLVENIELTEVKK